MSKSAKYTNEPGQSGPSGAAKPVQFHAELVRGGLQNRVVGSGGTGAGPRWLLVYVSSGTLELSGPAERREIPGPALLWQPVDPAVRISFFAGSVGAHLLIGELGLSAAVGSKPEAAEMRLMADRPHVLPLDGQGAVNTNITQAFNVILAEIAAAQPGMETIIEAQLRFLLVLIWRHVSMTSDRIARGAAQTVLLRRFRQLVEAHFRQRWKVADYARDLGTTADRLHAICRNTLGSSPLQLIHDRTIYEAQSLLDRSNMTIDQIADSLGFNSAAQFNKFFSTNAGMPPGRYRKLLRDSAADAKPQGMAGFTDWP
ncbi:helix-turn-helix domain-containing protein [Thalassovita mangrovi]|uniref:Helix-turn-helix domain-containing protein n=1 Tax=Thalassovita mangrovi TaxID=2692236 RepID=A0A6L8LGA1_9RHOB|nr:AraC family transcriptional regulator [Thalassovita mangrovi]MYM54948.1 helix-turn-helix domain-containing protein [Thalassovita mangrovi]